MNSIPIIPLEMQGMKHTVLKALQDHHIQMDEYIQQSLENFCSKEHLTSIVDQAVKAEMDAAVKAEIRDFFGYGKDGRRAVKEAILAYLKRQYPEECFEGELE